jgi:hypothetical protein
MFLSVETVNIILKFVAALSLTALCKLCLVARIM